MAWNQQLVSRPLYHAVLLIGNVNISTSADDYCLHGPLNTLRPRRNEQHFADGIFKRIFFNANVWIWIKISLEFVPKGSINHISALVHIMAWRCSGDKPLSEPKMLSLPTHICVTRPQWVNQRMYHRDSNAIENSLHSPQFYKSYPYKILYMIW